MQSGDGCMTLENYVIDIDRHQIETRIRALDHYSSGHLDRRRRLIDELESLDSGWYLFGLGPNFPHIVTVTTEPIFFGQGDTLDEGLAEPVVTHQVNETGTADEREVSKVHMAVRLNESNEFEVQDAGSLSGTWTEDASERLECGEWASVPSGGIIRLGPSGMNIFMAVCID